MARGAFIDGQWLCDCNPRQVAVHLPVKKEGPNKGRYFRVCQRKQKDAQRCKFFLWDSEAAPRENAALQSNSRTEPAHQNAITTPSRPPPQRPAPAPEAQASPSVPNQKRTRAHLQEDDEFGDGDLDFEALDQAREEAETPRKKARTEGFATPRRKLPWEKDSTTNAVGLQTPQTARQTLENPFVTNRLGNSSLTTPSRAAPSNAETVQTATPSSSPMDTPTPIRFKDVNTESDLAKEVFGVLKGADIALGEQARRDLSGILSKHTTVAEGVKRGRDAARSAIKAKDARVQELTLRVNTLEAELEAEKKKVVYLQFKDQNGYESD
ncbi:hypothetical protein CC80DRAFT_453191 [Byssothecium circinans]|uniref:GRF-type domain-containing protein n=1 Tax=Byssothecium circinans TaxID=147558 RepID=A0A6A5TJI3_9PLEO|nr:hypothetical protein CC80DRAFT_453191 [Byssothecium circinans]